MPSDDYNTSWNKIESILYISYIRKRKRNERERSRTHWNKWITIIGHMLDELPSSGAGTSLRDHIRLLENHGCCVKTCCRNCSKGFKISQGQSPWILWNFFTRNCRYMRFWRCLSGRGPIVPLPQIGLQSPNHNTSLPTPKTAKWLIWYQSSKTKIPKGWKPPTHVERLHKCIHKWL